MIRRFLVFSKSIVPVELVDLTVPEEQETPEEPAMLTEEQHEDDLAQHVREGGELDVAAHDVDLQLGCQ